MKKSPALIIPFAVITTILFLLFAADCPAASPELAPEKIDEVVTKIMKEKNIPGLSLAISMPEGRSREATVSPTWNTTSPWKGTPSSR